jgi:PPM family protein phosphatase
MANPKAIKARRLETESICSRVTVDIGALSHPGLVRSNNEDSFHVISFGRSLRTLLTNLPTEEAVTPHVEVGYGMLVADGVGGAAAGEVASRTAIQALIDLTIQTPDWILNLDKQHAQQVLHRMKVRFDSLKEAFEDRIRNDPSLAGMGTTMTVAVSLGDDLIIGHVGDSRAYIFSDGQLLRVTRDQTMAQVLADLGVISPEAIKRHHSRHILTGAITASGKKAEVELHHLSLLDGDQLLVCSDGLTEMVSDDDIVKVLEKGQSATEACQALVDMALEAGGKDNVTVILAAYHVPSKSEHN